MFASRFPAQAYQTFQIYSPIETHFRKATCEEIGCNEYLNGWALQIEQLSEEDYYLATHAGKRYRKANFGPGINFLMFESGQPCFDAASHKIKIERPEYFFNGRGDRRMFTRHGAQQMRANDWMDKLMTDVDRLLTEKAKG